MGISSSVSIGSGGGVSSGVDGKSAFDTGSPRKHLSPWMSRELKEIHEGHYQMWSLRLPLSHHGEKVRLNKIVEIPHRTGKRLEDHCYGIWRANWIGAMETSLNQ